MGIIQRQTITGTILTYLGVVIGFVTTGLIFPEYLTPEQIGLIGLLLSYSMIFAQLSSLGFASTTNFFFPAFRESNNRHHGFLFLALMVTLAGFILSWLVFLLIKPAIVANSAEKSALLIGYIHYVVPLTFSVAIFNAFDQYYKMLYNAVIGIALKEVVLRILILASVSLFVLSLINFSHFVFLYMMSYLVPLVLIVFSLARQNQLNFRPDFDFLNKPLVRRMASVSLYGIISSASLVVTLNLDRIMIDRFLGLGPTGIYTTMYFFGSLVIIPSRPLTKISSTIIADALKINDMEHLREIYYKSSLNQFIAGLLLLVGLWGNIDNVYRILPEQFLEGKYVVLVVGLAFLVNMAVGVNFSIVANSKYYRYSTYFLIAYVIILIGFNWILIPIYGITGAALSFLLSTLIVNGFLVLFVARAFRMFPFNYKYLLAAGLVTGVYFLSLLIPFLGNLILDIAVRSAFLGGSFLLLVFLLRISGDINDRIKVYLKRWLGITVKY